MTQRLRALTASPEVLSNGVYMGFCKEVIKAVMVYHLGAWEVEGRGIGTQGLFWLHSVLFLKSKMNRINIQTAIPFLWINPKELEQESWRHS